ncbi:hypothetical protein RclHR1_03060021 [Rhizophagus clarus]|uniref:Uncharacterized protein n=1 Tax=Rhizophagus clarus TaxID=94130 RepID=A0A2Z6RI36_9GLOM|nr:hypothetical protein RclHR1_03060021 [Rhizophagus clarus]GES79707.1 hypothetical protein RCL_e13736_RclHR1_03060021 [Rhizophagus clarus]
MYIAISFLGYKTLHNEHYQLSLSQTSYYRRQYHHQHISLITRCTKKESFLLTVYILRKRMIPSLSLVIIFIIQ